MAKRKSPQRVTASSNVRKDVNIEKARNGFIVSYNDKNYNRVSHIAKTKSDAKNIAMRLL